MSLIQTSKVQLSDVPYVLIVPHVNIVPIVPIAPHVPYVLIVLIAPFVPIAPWPVRRFPVAPEIVCSEETLWAS